VVLGYCLTVDLHHDPCREYLGDEPDEIYSGAEVAAEYEATAPAVSTRYADDVRTHRERVEESRFGGELGPDDLTAILSEEKSMADVIGELYEELPQVLYVDTLTRYLTQLARDIEQMAVERKERLDEVITAYWEREDEHGEVRSRLDIHEPDLSICIEGHDLGENVDGNVELATANPTDFVRGGTRSRIVTHTTMTDVIDLSATE
ncbi:MAG: hypothetical protein ABEI99_00390, partial [Halobaculum sp.]